MDTPVRGEQQLVPYYPEAAAAQEEPADLRHYWGVVDKHKWRILGLTFVVALLTWLVTLSLEPVYRSTATLLIEASPAKFIKIPNVYESGFQSYQYYETQYQILHSRALAEYVVNRFQLWKQPAFNPAAQAERRSALSLDWRAWVPKAWIPAWLAQAEVSRPPDEATLKAIAVGAVLAGLDVDPVQRSQLVRISFESNDPSLAATIANAVAEGYIENNLDARFQMVQKASNWLSERLATLRTKLDDSERALQAYRDREGLVDISGVKTLAVSDLDAVRERLEDARKRAVELSGLTTRLQSGGSDASSGSGEGQSLVQSLRLAESDAERDIAELSKRYGPKHPKMIAAQSKLEAVRSNLRKELGAAIGSASSESRRAQARVADLESQFAKAKAKLQQINRQEFELQKLQRDVETNRQLYDLFLTRMKETTAGAGEAETPNARVVDPATVPSAAYKPRTERILTVAVLLALAAGVALAFLLEQLDNTLKDSEDVEAKLRQPLLGLLPAIRAKGKDVSKPQRLFLDQHQSHFAEAIRTIRTSVLLSGLDNPHKLVLVTSALVGEGKTTVAMNLAFALGHLEKVLLIDADMRRPSVGPLCGLERDRPGLSNLIAGTAQPSECIHRLGDSNVHVLPSGMLPPNPLELLSSQKFAMVLEKLATVYDRLVVDSAPAQVVSDPMVLSAHANAVICVVKADSTPYPAVHASIKRLRQAGAPLIGVVLNQVDLHKSARYSKYGHYAGDYYAHYGYYREAS
jgi:succinoglycan biosynthesis transport protein ExoP